MNKRTQLDRLKKLQGKPKSGQATLHLQDGSKVLVSDMSAFAADCLFNAGGTTEILFQQVEVIDEPDGGRMGELLAMVIG